MNNDDSSPAGRRDSPLDLDLAIDRAVKRMMHVDPPAGLARRVLARLDAAPTVRTTRFPRLAFAAAALAMLVLAIVVARRDKPAPAPERGTQHGSTMAHANPSPVVAPQSATPPPAAPVPRASPQRARGPHLETIPMPRIGNVFGSRSAGVAATNAAGAGPDTVFPSAGVGPEAARAGTADEEALRIAPLPAIPEISIAPLRIEGLRVEPLPIRK